MVEGVAVYAGGVVCGPNWAEKKMNNDGWETGVGEERRAFIEVDSHLARGVGVMNGGGCDGDDVF